MGAKCRLKKEIPPSMNDPLPAPAFNLTVHVKSTDIDAGYAGGLERKSALLELEGALP